MCMWGGGRLELNRQGEKVWVNDPSLAGHRIQTDGNVGHSSYVCIVLYVDMDIV